VDVVDDTSPQLGGNLDVNGNSIVSASNGNITIAPNGSGNLFLTPSTGYLKLAAVKWPAGAGSANYVLKTDGTDQLSWVAQNASGIASVSADTSPVLGGDLDVSTYKIVTTSSNRNIELDPHGTGVVAVTGPMTISGNLTVNGTTTTVNSTTVDIADKNITLAKGAADAAAANGAGFTIEGPTTPATMEYVSATDRFLFNKQIAGSFFSNAASNFSGGTVNLGSNSNVTITGGTSGYVLRTDGAGALTWVANGPANTDALTEGSTNLYFTQARARESISGTGSISYNSSTGVISYTGATIASQTGNSGKFLTTNGSVTSWATAIADLVSDPAPTLGGDLDVNGLHIKTTQNNGSIVIKPNGTGYVKVGSGALAGKVTSNGAYNLILDTNSGTDSGQIIINQGANGNIAMLPNGTGKIRFYGVYNFPSADGSANQYLKTDGSGTLTWATVSSGWVGTATSDLNMDTYAIKGASNVVKVGAGDGIANLSSNGAYALKLSTDSNSGTSAFINIASGANANVGITPSGTGSVALNGPLVLTATSGTPTTYNTSYFEGTLDTPAAWFKVTVGANTYYLPMFQ
jgi:hypothetical protein